MYLSYYTGYWFEGGGQGDTIFKKKDVFQPSGRQLKITCILNTCKFKKPLAFAYPIYIFITLWCQVRVILTLS